MNSGLIFDWAADSKKNDSDHIILQKMHTFYAIQQFTSSRSVQFSLPHFYTVR